MSRLNKITPLLKLFPLHLRKKLFILTPLRQTRYFNFPIRSLLHPRTIMARTKQTARKAKSLVPRHQIPAHNGPVPSLSHLWVLRRAREPDSDVTAPARLRSDFLKARQREEGSDSDGAASIPSADRLCNRNGTTQHPHLDAETEVQKDTPVRNSQGRFVKKQNGLYQNKHLAQQLKHEVAVGQAEIVRLKAEKEADERLLAELQVQREKEAKSLEKDEATNEKLRTELTAQLKADLADEYPDYSACELCDDTGETICVICGGKGLIKKGCTVCEGTGTFSRGDYDYECGVCKDGWEN